jgi:anti-sigma regulatory factor (Ser/Thr protein kinase)
VSTTGRRRLPLRGRGGQDLGSAAGGDAALHLDAHLSSVGAARRFVEQALGTLVPPQVVADLVLATSELVTNAIEHADTAPGVDVTVRVANRTAFVTVISCGDHSGLAETELWATSAPDVRSGRGLGIVRAVSDHVDVVRAGDAVHITIRRSLD